jgi:hypothetical protein
VSKSDLVYSLQNIVTYTGTTSTTAVGSYNAAITDVLATSGSTTLSLAGFGISGSDQIQAGETRTTSTDWTVTLQTSLSATAQSSTSIKEALDDHHGLKGDGAFLSTRPRVDIYQDLLFGTFMFQDQSAPAAP